MNDFYYVYGLVLFNETKLGKLRLLKVGHTKHVIKHTPKNRMECLMKDYYCKNPETDSSITVWFVLSIPKNLTCNRVQIEKNARKHCGEEVSPRYARQNNFPAPTEWVFTTQSYLNKLRRHIKARPYANVDRLFEVEAFQLPQHFEDNYQIIIDELYY